VFTTVFQQATPTEWIDAEQGIENGITDLIRRFCRDALL